MKLENILKQLTKDGYTILKDEFNYQECWMVNGTALIERIDGEVNPTDASNY